MPAISVALIFLLLLSLVLSLVFGAISYFILGKKFPKEKAFKIALIISFATIILFILVFILLFSGPTYSY